MIRRAYCLGFLGLALVAACAERTPFEPVPGDVFAHRSDDDEGGSQRVVAMTRNLYIGTNVDAVIAALLTPGTGDDVAALDVAIATLRETAFPVRARALADEIARARPHVVGLQEVTVLDFPGIDNDLDFLALLDAALDRRGLEYEVAASVTNTSETVVHPTTGAAITLIDHDVILVDPDRVEDIGGVVEQNFVSPGKLPPLGPIEILRGWVQIDGTIEGMRVRMVNTHLEAGPGTALSQLRLAQAVQLLTSVGAAGPAILLGDLNDAPGSPMHALLTGAGFDDVWAELRPNAPGYTCCHAADLSNRRAAGEFDQRIDYVMARGFDHRNGRLLGQVRIVGASPGDRVRGPEHRIWPSDHAGVVAKLRLTPAPAVALVP